MKVKLKAKKPVSVLLLSILSLISLVTCLTLFRDLQWMITFKSQDWEPEDWEPEDYRKPLYKPEMVEDPWKKELFQRLDRIRVVCGTLCQLNTPKEMEKYTVTAPNQEPMLRVPDVDCPSLMALTELDAGDRSVPRIPSELLPFYSIGGASKVRRNERLRSDIYLGGASDLSLWKTGNVWKQVDIDNAVRQVATGTLLGTYKIKGTVYVRDKLAQVADRIRGGHILVIGSSHPWLEATLLHWGAANVSTLEYGTIHSEHPQLHTYTPDVFKQEYLAGRLPQFDGVASHSSIEHSGLGRYGDALSPWGDILTVAQAWCVARPGAFLYLGLPTGQDQIRSNWHRIYGNVRWPLVTVNWTPLDRAGKERRRSMEAAEANGGYGYIFQKD